MVGFNDIPGNVNNTMKQLQKMQKQMGEQAKTFKDKRSEATAGGGAMCVTVIGGREVSKITLDKDAAGPDDVEVLENLIKVVVNEAPHMAEVENQQMMGKLAGELPF